MADQRLTPAHSRSLHHGIRNCMMITCDQSGVTGLAAPGCTPLLHPDLVSRPRSAQLHQVTSQQQRTEGDETSNISKAQTFSKTAAAILHTALSAQITFNQLMWACCKIIAESGDSRELVVVHKTIRAYLCDTGALCRCYESSVRDTYLKSTFT